MNEEPPNSQILSDSVRKLTRRQQRAIAFLVTCPTQEEACRSAGVTRETINTWKRNPVFQAELERQQQLVFSEAIGAIKQSVDEAVVSLRNLVKSENENIRLRASVECIRLGLRIREQIEIEERVRVLEERQESFDDARLSRD